MTRTRKPTIRPQGGTASTWPTYLASDGTSGALISIERSATGQLVIEVWRADADVVVSAPVESLDPRLVIELNSRALAVGREV